MNDEKLKRMEEIDNIGKIIQRNLATRVVGFDDPNFLALAIRDLEDVRVNEKSVRLGFRSFKELLESQEMSKFVEVFERNGTDKTTYKARKDETTRLVMEQQQRFAVEQMRRERMRQHHQLPTAAAKTHCAIVPSSRLSFLHVKPIEPQLSIERKRSEYKWDIDLKTSSDDKLKASIDHRRSVASIQPQKNVPPPATCSFSPSSPIKKQSFFGQFEFSWMRIERFAEPSARRYNGICAECPEYNVDFVMDPRPRFRTYSASIFEPIPIPEFFAKNEVTAGGEVDCELINVEATDSSDETFCSEAVAGENAAGILTEEKMRHLGAIAICICKYQFKFGDFAPIKFEKLHKVLSGLEPSFDRLLKDNQQLVDFFTLFCPKLKLVYPPTEFEIDKFQLYWNPSNGLDE
uniref:DUF7515 domain-containing protein n=1 Tax=Globodera rostochiensis TaxID=31243 RepID=A0A914HVJ8_GLORO